MLRPKKIHTRNLITKKKFPVAREFPTPLPPPHNFSNGPSLSSTADQGCFELRPCSCCFSPVLYYHSIRLGFLKVQCMCKPDLLTLSNSIM